MTDVTVVIPAHNAAQYVRTCLDSVAGQTRLPEEVIIVENGSSDGTRDACADWIAAHDLQVRLVSLDYGNVSNARNVGCSLATTTLVALLDADDCYMADFLETSVEAFRLMSDIDLFFGDRMLFDERTGDLGPALAKSGLRFVYRDAVTPTVFRLTEGLLEALAAGNFISPSGSVCRRASAYAAGLFNPRLKSSEDREFFFRMAALGPVAYTPNLVTRYRVHAASTMAVTETVELQKNALRSIVAILADSDQLKLTRSQIQALASVRQVCAGRILSLARRAGFKCLRAEQSWLRGLNAGGWLRALIWPLTVRVSRFWPRRWRGRSDAVSREGAPSSVPPLSPQ
ncbi:glycosyltransferase [Rhodovibrio salinarum]|nr:glycosyltransferase [Rhodovibrio salinarum]